MLRHRHRVCEHCRPLSLYPIDATSDIYFEHTCIMLYVGSQREYETLYKIVCRPITIDTALVKKLAPCA